MNRTGLLSGLLDLERVVLAGHSGGGTVALENANPAWFPVVATFTYAAHTMASVMLGHGPSTVLAMPGAIPTLMVAGELDGVMAASSDRYRAVADAPHDPVARTFDEAFAGGRGDGSRRCWSGQPTPP